MSAQEMANCEQSGIINCPFTLPRVTRKEFTCTTAVYDNQHKEFKERCDDSISSHIPVLAYIVEIDIRKIPHNNI